MATRALPDLVARIRVDSSGVDQALLSLVHSFGKADLAMAGVAAGLGLLIIGGKSMVDIAEKHDAATRGLEQAYKSAGLQLDKYQGSIDGFIQTNRRYINNQSDVIDGYAKLTRSGLTQAEVQKDMGRALDLSALKHISLNDAVNLLVAAEHGRMRGLIDLGITSSKYTDAQGNLIKSSHNVRDAMAEMDQKLKGGRQTLTDLQQHSNQLSNDWQDLSNKGGPVLLKVLDKVVTSVSAIYDWFDRTGKDDKLWSTISDRLVNMAKWIHDWIIVPLGKVNEFLSAYPTTTGSNPGGANPRQPGGRASGGPVVPGTLYDIGEMGPEKLLLYPGGGGTVIPNDGRRASASGTGQMVNHFHQVMADPWQIANELTWAKKTQRL